MGNEVTQPGNNSSEWQSAIWIRCAIARFYARQLYRQVLLRARISYGDAVCLSVRLSVLVSRPGTESSPGEIETPGLHCVIA